MNQKHYVIIGGTAGIGKAIVKKLETENHKISVVSRGNYSVENNNPNIEYYIADVNNSSGYLPDISTEINGLIYCPGSINLRPFKSLKTDDFISDLQINFLSAVSTIQNYLPQLVSSGSGSIVLFSTVAVQTGMPFHTSTAASKGAIEGFARSLAAELSPKVRVNVIAPSLVNTQLSGRLINNEQKLESANQRHPLKRIGDPEDIAELACYLIGDKSNWVTAQIFNVDGGLSAIK